jgi:hypothetical protein
MGKDSVILRDHDLMGKGHTGHITLLNYILMVADLVVVLSYV